MPHFRLFYHFVWATKLRLPLISDTNRDAIFGSIVAKNLNEIKGASSHLANHLETSRSDQSFRWQDTYSVTSISESHVPAVVRYVKNQQKHHAPGGSVDVRLEEDA
jgi:putative transposase